MFSLTCIAMLANPIASCIFDMQKCTSEQRISVLSVSVKASLMFAYLQTNVKTLPFNSLIRSTHVRLGNRLRIGSALAGFCRLRTAIRFVILPFKC